MSSPSSRSSIFFWNGQWNSSTLFLVGNSLSGYPLDREANCVFRPDSDTSNSLSTSLPLVNCIQTRAEDIQTMPHNIPTHQINDLLLALPPKQFNFVWLGLTWLGFHHCLWVFSPSIVPFIMGSSCWTGWSKSTFRDHFYWVQQKLLDKKKPLGITPTSIEAFSRNSAPKLMKYELRANIQRVVRGS